MVLGPSHGGWGRDVNPDAFREANAGTRVVLRIGNKIDVIFSQRGTGKERDFFKSAGIILEGALLPAAMPPTAACHSHTPYHASSALILATLLPCYLAATAAAAAAAAAGTGSINTPPHVFRGGNTTCTI